MPRGTHHCFTFDRFTPGSTRLIHESWTGSSLSPMPRGTHLLKPWSLTHTIIKFCCIKLIYSCLGAPQIFN